MFLAYTKKMSISKSSLESKWLYRTVIALFQIVPLIVIIIALTKWRIVIPELTQKAIVAALSKNVLNIVYRIGGIIGYYLIMMGLWKLILYIGFGSNSDGKTYKNEKKITPIKQSFLEKQRRYRILKVIFFALPVAVLLILFFNGKINIPVITQKNILDVIESNIRYVWGVFIWYVIYIGIISSIRKLILFVGFGGIINDTIKVPKPLTGRAAKYAAMITPQTQQQKDNWWRVVFLLIMIMLIIGASYNQSGTYKTYYNSRGTTSSTYHKYCNPGNTYNYSSRRCCPNTAPFYFPGGYGYSAGCYPSCPYGNECGTLRSRY